MEKEIFDRRQYFCELEQALQHLHCAIKKYRDAEAATLRLWEKLKDCEDAPCCRERIFPPNRSYQPALETVKQLLQFGYQKMPSFWHRLLLKRFLRRHKTLMQDELVQKLLKSFR